MSKLYKVAGRNILVVIIAAIVIILIAGEVFATQENKKVFVCKYIGEPGVDERLQTGQNPINVSINSIKDYQGVGSYFNDEHGRSFVVAEDTGQEEPECPVPKNDTPEQEKPPTPGTSRFNDESQPEFGQTIQTQGGGK